MLPTDVTFLIRHEQNKDLLREADCERLIAMVERPAQRGLWQVMGNWMPHRIKSQLMIPTFRLYSK